MNQFGTVVKAILKSTFGISMLRWRYIKKRQRLWEPVLIVWGIGSAISVLGFGLYNLALAVATGGNAVNQPELVLGIGIASMQAMVLVFGLFYVISTFYLAKDLNLLTTLPLKPSTIILAKFAVVLIGEYLTGAFFYVPSVAAYMSFRALDIGRVIASAVVFLAAPVLPLAISSLVALALMRVINRRHRDKYMVILSLVMLVVILGVQTLTVRSASHNPQQMMNELIMSRLGLLRAVTRNFPPARWAALAIHLWPSAEGFTYLALTLATAAISLWVLGRAGEWLFLRGLIGGNEEGRGASKRRVRRATTELLDPPAPVFRALALREWRLFVRTPIWVMNGLLPALIVPFALIMPMATSGELREIIGQIQSSQKVLMYVGLGIAGLLTFMGSINTFASTSISREGRRLWISRTMPQSARLQVRAKMAVAMGIAGIAIVPTMIAYGYFVKPPLIHILMPALIGLLGTACGLVFGLRIDIARPMLNWEDPQEPVKRNLNGIIPMLVPFVLIAAGAWLAGRLARAGLTPAAIYLTLLALVSLLALGMWANLMRASERAYRLVES